MIAYLSLEEFAIRRGKSASYLRDLQARDLKRIREGGAWILLPEPDSVTGESSGRPRYGWLPETVDGWVPVGQGARTDRL